MIKFIWCAAVFLGLVFSNELLADNFTKNNNLKQISANKKIKLKSNSRQNLNTQSQIQQMAKNPKMQEFFNLAGVKNSEYLGSKFVSPDSINTQKKITKTINPLQITSSPTLANLQNQPKKAPNKKANKLYKNSNKPVSDGLKGYENTPYLMHTEVIYLY